MLGCPYAVFASRLSMPTAVRWAVENRRGAEDVGAAEAAMLDADGEKPHELVGGIRMLLSSAAEDGTKCCYQMAKPEDIDEAGLQVSRCFRLSPLLHSLCTAPCRALCRGHSEVAACSDRCCFFRLLIIRTRRSSRGPRSSTWQSLRLGPRSSCARGYSSSCGDPPPVVAKCKGEGEGEGEGKGERVSIGDCVIKKTKTETA